MTQICFYIIIYYYITLLFLFVKNTVGIDNLVLLPPPVSFFLSSALPAHSSFRRRTILYPLLYNIIA
jgi:hypothetical protein